MWYWHETLVLYVVSFLVHTLGIDPSCECVVYQSLGLSKGTFQSPDYPNFYDHGINCILFTFIGDFNEIVEIKFIAMDLQGRNYANNCTDFLKVYMNLDRPEVNENTPSDETLCGSIDDMHESKIFYSSGRALVLEFHTSKMSRENHAGFKGTFTFKGKSEYRTDGILQLGTQCNWDIQRGPNRTKGDIFSPRFPQKYPPNAICQYTFMGFDSERVRVIFKKIHLHNGHKGCNGDFINVYDGNDSFKPLVRQFCDSPDQNPNQIISSGPYMYIEFHSDGRHEKQGFQAEYEFFSARDEHYQGGGTSPPTPDVATVILGNRPVTIPNDQNCTQTIDSSKLALKSNKLQSPNYPGAYPQGIRCQYDFIAHGQERIQINITHMNLYYSSGDPKDPYDCTDEDKLTVIVYIEGKEERLGEYCGQKPPPVLMSNGDRMKVVFNSFNNVRSEFAGYVIEYQFRTDFGVQGNGVQDFRNSCRFEYTRNRYKTGIFTSPNYPGPYPRNTECIYIFKGEAKGKEYVEIEFLDISLSSDGTKSMGGIFTSPNYGGQYPRLTECRFLFYGRRHEHVVIEFLNFDVDGIIPRCDKADKSDYIEFSNFLNAVDRQMPRYCGSQTTYLPQRSDSAFFKVTFKSNEKFDADGFRARYTFKTDLKAPITPETGNLVTVTAETRTGASGRMAGTCWLTTFMLMLAVISAHINPLHGH